MKRPSRSCQRGGWTLIELAVVVAIAVLLTASAVVTFRVPLEGARLETAATQASRFVQTWQSHARRHQTALQLRVDLRQQSLTVHYAGTTSLLASRALSMGASAESILMIDGSNTEAATVLIDAAGRCETFAIKIQTDQQERWILFAGGSEYAATYENERQVRQAFSALRQARNDLD